MSLYALPIFLGTYPFGFSPTKATPYMSFPFKVCLTKVKSGTLVPSGYEITNFWITSSSEAFWTSSPRTLSISTLFVTTLTPAFRIRLMSCWPFSFSCAILSLVEEIAALVPVLDVWEELFLTDLPPPRGCFFHIVFVWRVLFSPDKSSTIYIVPSGYSFIYLTVNSPRFDAFPLVMRVGASNVSMYLL